MSVTASNAAHAEAAPSVRGSENGNGSLVIDRVRRSYPSNNGELLALDDVSIEMPAGGFLAIVGPSGCGKSTLLRLLGALDEPDAGSITLGGQSPVALRDSHKIGVAFQDAALLPWRTSVANIALPFQVAGLPRPSDRIEELLDLVGLSGFGQAKPHELSGGMRQRVALARALALDPQLLLLDEPFGALDAITRENLNVALLEISDRLRSTTVLITHSVPEAVFLADRVVVLSARPGRVAATIDVPFGRGREPGLARTPEFHSVSDDVSAALAGAMSLD